MGSALFKNSFSIKWINEFVSHKLIYFASMSSKSNISRSERLRGSNDKILKCSSNDSNHDYIANAAKVGLNFGFHSNDRKLALTDMNVRQGKEQYAIKCFDKGA